MNRFGDNLQHWEDAAFDYLPQQIIDGRAVLQDWFLAMEDGSVSMRQPDPLYPKQFTEAEVNEVIRKIDLSFNYERWLVGHFYDEGPGFYRLEPAQRLALVQVLHSIMKDYSAPHTSWPHIQAEAPIPPDYASSFDDWG